MLASIDKRGPAKMRTPLSQKPSALRTETMKSSRYRHEECHEILSEVRTKALPPACSVLFLNIRKISEFGVRRLMQSFRDVGSPDYLYAGALAMGNLPLVFPLTEHLADHQKSNFVDDIGSSDAHADAEVEVSKFSCWYGIVEGRHRNEALRRRQLPDSFTAFTWTGLLLKPAAV